MTQKAAAPMVLVPKKAIVTEGNANSVWVVAQRFGASVPVVLGREFPGRARSQAGTERRRDGDRSASADDS